MLPNPYGALAQERGRPSYSSHGRWAWRYTTDRSDTPGHHLDAIGASPPWHGTGLVGLSEHARRPAAYHPGLPGRDDAALCCGAPARSPHSAEHAWPSTARCLTVCLPVQWSICSARAVWPETLLRRAVHRPPCRASPRTSPLSTQKPPTFCKNRLILSRKSPFISLVFWPEKQHAVPPPQPGACPAVAPRKEET